jgi:hypothetical protein
MAKYEVPTIDQAAMEPTNELARGVAAEVDGDVATDDQIQLGSLEGERVGDEVVQSELDQRADDVGHRVRTVWLCRWLGIEPPRDGSSFGQLDGPAGVDPLSGYGKR